MATITPKPLDRPLNEVAWEIIQDYAHSGKTVPFAARPYVGAMRHLDSLDDVYFQDTADSIVRYALSNLNSWRGDTARRVKAELRAALESRR